MSTPDLPKLKGEGETRTQVRRRRECSVCGEPATKRISYLMDNCRSDPASAAYHHDDCTWCSDAEAFACDTHRREVERDAPSGMSRGSTFDGSRLPHMLLYWDAAT